MTEKVTKNTFSDSYFSACFVHLYKNQSAAGAGGLGIIRGKKSRRN